MSQFRGVPTTNLLADGYLLGDYEIVTVAGVGGMGVVYKARQRSLDRIVALKVIRDEIARTPEYRERFLREARLAASVDHPHVVSIYDVNESEEQLFLAMQWIDGDDLKRILDHSGRLAPRRAVQIATQIAGALDAVHGIAGLVHRDIKPANVLIRRVGAADHAYLTDFGVAKPSDSTDHLTQTGRVVGTSGYVSPEQIRGAEPGPHSDVYALGCILFETLTGQPPFVAENDMALRWAHANDPRPAASSVLPALGQRYDAFFATALAVDPAVRFRSGRDFADALGQASADDTAATGKMFVAPTPTAVGPPTLVAPSYGGPQTPTPLYPSYGYATPPAAHGSSSRGGNWLALILLSIVALAGVAVGALAAAGVFSRTAASSGSSSPSAQSASHTNRASTQPASIKPVTKTRAAAAKPVAATSTSGSPSTTTIPTTSSTPQPASVAPTTYSQVSPPSRDYSILLPSDWTYQSGSGSTDLWVGPEADEQLQVTVSSCASCVTSGSSPDPAGAGTPQGTFSTSKLNPYALAFEASTGSNPFPDNGVDVVTTQGSTITGYAQIDLWLPNTAHAEATKILNSFSLLQATNG